MRPKAYLPPVAHVFAIPPFPGYSLLDSGDARKLERFGEVVVDRPDPQALWRPRRERSEWERRRDLVFVRESDRGGRWEDARGSGARGKGPGVREWSVPFGAARFLVRPTSFKHVGLFPEQAANWTWVAGLRAQLGASPSSGAPRLLNLFGYTGAASILAVQAGYDVTHVDASRASLAWARENAAASGLDERAFRVVLEDALTFARREARRGQRYAGILVDPPHYGRGPKGEKWQLEESLAPLLEACGELLAERSFLVLSTYAVGYSPLAFRNVLSEIEGGAVEVGELALPEELESARPPRLLPCGFCARWWRGLDAPS